MTAPGAPFTVEAVAGRRGMARFIDVPWHLFDRGRDPQWSPPLRVVTRDLIDPGRDPFYRHAAIQLFVASRGRRLLGRVAAVENRAHNRHHGDRVGFFGFFECVDDPAVARALLTAAEDWLRGRGLQVARGPVSPSMNHECGLLVDGCEGETMILTPWNPPWYAQLLTSAGYGKAKDLLGFELPSSMGDVLSERVARVARRAAARAGLTFRDGTEVSFSEAMPRLRPLYVESWAGKWGFVPPTEEEFVHLGRSLQPLVDKELSCMAELGGEPVGFWITVRNFNRVFQKIPSGRLGPGALWHLLVGSRKVREGRIILLGLRREVRRMGLYPVFVHEIISRAQRTGLERGEGSWILEDDLDSVGPLESMGARATRRWRIYEKVLDR